MTTTECYVGMHTQLPMLYDTTEPGSHKPQMLRATYVWIHPQKLYALFQFDRSGIKETVHLVDPERACSRADIKPAETTRIYIKRTAVPSTQNQRVENAIVDLAVTKREASMRAGRAQSYLAYRLRNKEIDKAEADMWIAVIEEIAQAHAAAEIDKDDPYYTLKLAMRDSHVNKTEASRLLGYHDQWLSERMKSPMYPAQQAAFAKTIRDRSESPRNGETDLSDRHTSEI